MPSKTERPLLRKQLPALGDADAALKLSSAGRRLEPETDARRFSALNTKVGAVLETSPGRLRINKRASSAAKPA